MIRDFFKRLGSLARIWPELWSIPLAFGLWFFSPFILRLVDPTAGTYDAGVLQILLFAVISVLLWNGLSFLNLMFNWKTLFRYYIADFANDFKSLTSWQRIKVLLYLWSFSMLCFLLAARAL